MTNTVAGRRCVVRSSPGLLWSARLSPLLLCFLLATVVVDLKLVVPVSGESSNEATQEHAGSSVHHDPSEPHGVDVSFPTHYPDLRRGGSVDQSNREWVYQHFMEGCQIVLNEKICQANEEERLERNRNQPRVMTVRPMLYALS